MKKIILIAVASFAMMIAGLVGASTVSAAGWTPLRHDYGVNGEAYRGVTAGACRVGTIAPYKVKVLVVRSDTTALRSNVKYKTFFTDPGNGIETTPLTTWSYYGTLQVHEVNNMINGYVNARVRFSNNELKTWYMVNSGGWEVYPSDLEICP